MNLSTFTKPLSTAATVVVFTPVIAVTLATAIVISPLVYFKARKLIKQLQVAPLSAFDAEHPIRRTSPTSRRGRTFTPTMES